MIPVQPFNIFSYISKNTNEKLPDGIKCLHYLSWEDAAWDVIKFKKIEKGSVALIPSFWCVDVVKNMRAHGIVCAHYKCNQNFQTDEKILIDAIKKYSPKIIIIFHAVGIKNELLTQNTDWIDEIPDDTLIIEDSVHSVVNPEEVKITKKNHFIIDSWRKVMPLQGAAIYGKKEDLFWGEPKLSQSLFNKFTVIFFWIIFQILLFLQYISHGRISIFLGNLAEKFMILGYDFIGDGKEASGTFNIFTKLHSKLDYKKIKKIKRDQVLQYEKLMKDIFKSNEFVQQVKYQESDIEELRGFPVRFSLEFADKALANLRKNGLFVRLELNDSPWSQKNKIIFLPLGPHLNNRDIEKVVEISKNSIKFCRQ